MQKFIKEKLIENLNKARLATEEYVKKELAGPREIDLDAHSYVFIKVDGLKDFGIHLLKVQ